MGLGKFVETSLDAQALLRLAVLPLLAVGIPIWGRWAGGRVVSYGSVTLGVVLLIVVEVLNILAPAAALEGAASGRAATAHLLLHLAAYFFILTGCVFWCRDLYLAHKAARDRIRTEQRQTKEVRLKEAKLRAILNCATEHCIIVCDSEGLVTSYTPGSAHILGWGPHEVIGKMNVRQFHPPHEHAIVERVMRTVREQGLFEEEIHMVRKDGGVFWALLTVTELTGADGSGEGCLAIAKDITRLKEAESRLRREQTRLECAKADLERANEELKRLAATDYLTGLANRRHANILLDREITRSRRNQTPLGVVIMDIDHFKLVNDRYGHETGDAVLKHVGKLLRGRLRAADIVARYGGEEFLLVFPDTNLDDAAQVADVVRRRLNDHPAHCGDLEISLRASLGVTVLRPGQNLFRKDLVHMADEAMYAAKRLGGNRAVTWQEVNSGDAEPSLAHLAETRRIQQCVGSMTEKKQNVCLEHLYQFVQTLEMRHDCFAHHSEHVADYAAAVADRMGLRPDQREVIRHAAMLHDLGKYAIPDDVLRKQGPLSQSEWALVRQHPAVGAKILEGLRFLRRETGVVRHHHERPDGRGYPDGLTGEAIPIEARVLAVANALDALTSPRPHRGAYSLQEALAYLRRGAGDQFDAQVVEAVLAAADQADNWPLAKTDSEAVGAGADGSASFERPARRPPPRR